MGKKRISSGPGPNEGSAKKTSTRVDPGFGVGRSSHYLGVAVLRSCKEWPDPLAPGKSETEDLEKSRLYSSGAHAGLLTIRVEIHAL